MAAAAAAAPLLARVEGLLAHLDAQLKRNPADPDFEGLFRVSCDQASFAELQARAATVPSSSGMRAVAQGYSVSVCGRLVKALLADLDQPLIPLAYALQSFVPASEDRSAVGADVTESLLYEIANARLEDDCANWAACAAQLFSFLCHVTMVPATKMNAYALSVVMFPCLSGARDPTAEEIAFEQKSFIAFQTNHRQGLQSQLEGLIQYGRRVWGVVLDLQPNLLEDLKSLRRATAKRRVSFIARRIVQPMARIAKQATIPFSHLGDGIFPGAASQSATAATATAAANGGYATAAGAPYATGNTLPRMPRSNINRSVSTMVDGTTSEDDADDDENGDSISEMLGRLAPSASVMGGGAAGPTTTTTTKAAATDANPEESISTRSALRSSSSSPPRVMPPVSRSSSSSPSLSASTVAAARRASSSRNTGSPPPPHALPLTRSESLGSIGKNIIRQASREVASNGHGNHKTVAFRDDDNMIA